MFPSYMLWMIAGSGLAVIVIGLLFVSWSPQKPSPAAVTTVWWVATMVGATTFGSILWQNMQATADVTSVDIAALSTSAVLVCLFLFQAIRTTRHRSGV